MPYTSHGRSAGLRRQRPRQPRRVRVLGLAVQDGMVRIAGVDQVGRLDQQARPGVSPGVWLGESAPLLHQAGGTERWSTSLPTAHIRTAGWARYCSTQAEHGVGERAPDRRVA